MFKKIISVLTCFIILTQSIVAVDLPVDVDYRISSGDVLSIVIYPAEELSKEITVSPDGSIDLPLVGNIKVSGLKVSELEKILIERYSKYVSNIRISISVRKFASYRVAIIGQVQRTGYYEYTEGMKILDLIASAGGPSDYADSKNIKVYRKNKTSDGKITEEIFTLSMDSFFKGNLDKNIDLMPGDVVYIPRQKFTSTSKWITDNILPWTILATFGLSVGIISRK